MGHTQASWGTEKATPSPSFLSHPRGLLWLLPNESSAMRILDALKQLCIKSAPAAHTRLCQCPSYSKAMLLPWEPSQVRLARSPLFSMTSAVQEGKRVPHRRDPETGPEASPGASFLPWLCECLEKCWCHIGLGFLR